MDERNRQDPTISRRGFVAAATSVAAVSLLPTTPALARTTGAPPVHSPPSSSLPPAAGIYDLAEQSITELQAALGRGELTSHRLVEQYLQRIESMDRQGPSLRYVLETNPDALALADQLDVERKAGKLRGPLHGIPVLVKDNIDTADRMSTTAGSLALADARPVRDAYVVERLRAAGAILLGKTNLSEWANFRSTHASSGWSARGGQARNPYALDRSPSGSSSGSAGAVASNYCSVAVGTETDGSITSPAAACSLVGIKPTVGLVSRSGIVPISHSQDTAGPMTRSVSDAAALLTVLAGADPRDVATRGAKALDYARFLDPNGLRGARIGVAREKFTGYSHATDAVFETALAVMKDRGAVLVDSANIATVAGLGDAEFDVLLFEFKDDLRRYLASRPAGARARSLDDLIAFNRAHADTEMPYFAQEIFEMSAKKGSLQSTAYLKALAKCRDGSRTKGLDATFAKYRVDAIVAPTQGPPWLIDLVNGDSSGGSSTSPCAVAGYPAISVPMGYTRGLPLGVTFMGKAWSESVLIKLAYAYEQAAAVRKPPTFAATAEI
ncbi:MAG: N-carbamoylputrescine amidase [Gemmatimonadetes bacterium]|nr:N-carbamoylputrescine amidase [Gemmatimonadota bacterium]